MSDSLPPVEELRRLLYTPVLSDVLDSSLADLVKQKVITREEAARQADDPQKFAS